MGFKLRSTKQDAPLQGIVVDENLNTEVVNIGEYEGIFAIHVRWISGASLNMNISLEVSNTGNEEEFVPFGGSTQSISGGTGNHFWDIDTGANFIRVVFEVVSGSGEFSVLFNGKQRV